MAFVRNHNVHGNTYQSVVQSVRIPGIKTPRQVYIEYLGNGKTYRKKSPKYSFMRPTSAINIPIGKDWVAERKYDGTRELLYIDKNGMAFINRRKINKTKQYPELWEMAKKLKYKNSVILDGEMVSFKGGTDNFAELSSREHLKDKLVIFQKSKENPLTYVAFDILDKDGKSLVNLQLKERREILDKTIPDTLKRIQEIKYSTNLEKKIKQVRKQKGEGVIFKNLKSPYISGKSNLWQKLKFQKEADVVITGYTEGTGKRKETFGALNMSVWDKKLKKYKDVGKVGTGFDNQQLINIKKELDKYKIKKEGKITKLNPKVIAKVKFAQIGSQGNLREPVFLAFRTDITPKETHTSKLIKIKKKGKVVITKEPDEVRKLAKAVELKIKPYTQKIKIAGSIRRHKDPTDIDIVAIPKDKEKIKNVLKEMGGTLVQSGEHKITYKLKGVNTEIYFTEPESWGATLLTYTGPVEANLGNRTLARNKGLLLNQYGLFKGKKKIAGETEESIYNKLGKIYREPELRSLPRKEEKWKIRYVKDIPKEYIGMNYYAAKELGIPFPEDKHLIWIKKGYKRMNKSTKRHEKTEAELMRSGLKYEEAHSIATNLENKP